MESLENSADSLSSCLQKAEGDLRSVSRQFEEEFHRRFSKSQANPFALLQRLKKLEREIPLVREECRALLSAKQVCFQCLEHQKAAHLDLVDKANRSLLGNREMLAQLENKSGKKNGEDGETFTAFRGAMQEWNDKVNLIPSGLQEVQGTHDSLNKALVDSVLTS